MTFLTYFAATLGIFAGASLGLVFLALAGFALRGLASAAKRRARGWR